MTYFWFLDSDHSPMVAVEPLAGDNVEDAKRKARELLKSHRAARLARVYLDADEVAVVEAYGGRA